MECVTPVKMKPLNKHFRNLSDFLLTNTHIRNLLIFTRILNCLYFTPHKMLRYNPFNKKVRINRIQVNVKPFQNQQFRREDNFSRYNKIHSKRFKQIVKNYNILLYSKKKIIMHLCSLNIINYTFKNRTLKKSVDGKTYRITHSKLLNEIHRL